MQVIKVVEIIFLYPLFTSVTLCKERTDPRILILGAGMSGVSAAKRLKELGYTNFDILESSDRVGGRVNHESLGDYTIELGPVVIHAVDDSPIFALAKAYNLSYGYVNYSDSVVRGKGSTNITTDAQEVYLERFFPALAVLKSQISQAKAEDRPDFSLRSALLKAGWRPGSLLDELIEHLEIDVLYGYGPEEISGKYAFLSEVKESTNTFGDIYINDDRGYVHIVQKLLDEAIGNDKEKLKLNKTVTAIERTDQVTVSTLTGETYTADYVIMTFSLGVLQGKTIQFKPELPEWKMDAIQQFQMGKYTNIYLQFNISFWDETEWIMYADDSDTFNAIFNGNKAYPGSNMLHFQVVNKNSLRIESLSDEEIIQMIVYKLKKLYAPLNVNVPSPVRYKISRYSKNPLFLGAWSNWPPGYTKDSHDALKAPVARLYFAGEHTSYRHYGYLHGAYYSGIDVSDALDKCIQQSDCQEYTPIYEARGCVYSAASNYDPTAKEDDKSCKFTCVSTSDHKEYSLIILLFPMTAFIIV